MRGSPGGRQTRGGPGGIDSSGGGFTSINGTAVSGSVDLRSPMASVSGAVLRIDNANVKYLTAADTITGIDVDLNTSFELQLDRATAAMSAPTASLITTPRDGEKITFTFKQFSETIRAITWTGGAGGYLFAAAALTPSAGVKLADFNALMGVLAAGGGAGAAIKIGFEYISDLNKWLAVALAGVWQS